MASVFKRFPNRGPIEINYDAFQQVRMQIKQGFSQQRDSRGNCTSTRSNARNLLAPNGILLYALTLSARAAFDDGQLPIDTKWFYLKRLALVPANWTLSDPNFRY
jgi:hypothetical protein